MYTLTSLDSAGGRITFGGSGGGVFVSKSFVKPKHVNSKSNELVTNFKSQDDGLQGLIWSLVILVSSLPIFSYPGLKARFSTMNSDEDLISSVLDLQHSDSLTLSICYCSPLCSLIPPPPLTIHCQSPMAICFYNC